MLFDKKTVLMTDPENSDEKNHLLYVIGVVAAKVIANARPLAHKFKKLLPSHHKHENAATEHSPALAFVLKPYPLQETKNADTIKLLLKIQRKYLEAVAKFKCNDPEFLKLLGLLEDLDIDDSVREAAEKQVMKACQEFGELIIHGDLLTVKERL